MSTLSYAISDSATMLRRSLRHTVRYPAMMIMSLGLPVVMLLLFVGVFGGALSAGLGVGSHGGRYVDYVVPGILLMTVGYGSSTTSLAVNRDMTGGIIARFRTMAISRTSVLTGHVLAAMIRTIAGMGLVIGVALLLGFRPTGDPVRWVAVAGVVVLLVLALIWLAVAVGLAARNAEGTGSFTLVTQVLPFISSAFVPPDSMSGVVRWFAGNEPFTPIINTLRALLMGAPVGDTAVIAVAWCAGIALAGYLWARALFRRDPR
ncbi:MAG TPA: ABC transporter permease [Rugosimonospora sp.]